MINDKEVHVYLKEDAMDKYKALKPAVSKFGSRPNFTFEAINAEDFKNEIKDIQTDEGVDKADWFMWNHEHSQTGSHLS